MREVFGGVLRFGRFHTTQTQQKLYASSTRSTGLSLLLFIWQMHLQLDVETSK